MIIALAGRRIDAAGAKVAHFPVENVETVEQRIRSLFEEHKPQALVCSAANGADLLALAVACELGIYREIMLPFPPDVFRELSVTDRPGNWGWRFDRVITDEGRQQITCLNTPAKGEAAYIVANQAILDRAASLGCEKNQAVWAVIVWNAASRGGQDVTLSFRDAAQTAGMRIIEVPTI
ncbi:MAG: hypothetical protein WCA91_13045 [Candidatus Acidiferrales bacterium]